MLILGLVISLVAAPLLLLLAGRLRPDSWALGPRIALWINGAFLFMRPARIRRGAQSERGRA